MIKLILFCLQLDVILYVLKEIQQYEIKMKIQQY